MVKLFESLYPWITASGNEYTDPKKKCKYYVVETGVDTYEVSKFKGGSTPDEVYKVTRDADGAWECSCKGFEFGVTVLHIDLVRDWITKGKPGSPYGSPEDLGVGYSDLLKQKISQMVNS